MKNEQREMDQHQRLNRDSTDYLRSSKRKLPETQQSVKIIQREGPTEKTKSPKKKEEMDSVASDKKLAPNYTSS